MIIILESCNFRYKVNGSTMNVSMRPRGEARGVLPPAARALCALPLREPAALRDCARPAALHDWRNCILAPLLIAHRLPVVPVTAARWHAWRAAPGWTGLHPLVPRMRRQPAYGGRGTQPTKGAIAIRV